MPERRRGSLFHLAQECHGHLGVSSASPGAAHRDRCLPAGQQARGALRGKTAGADVFRRRGQDTGHLAALAFHVRAEEDRVVSEPLRLTPRPGRTESAAGCIHAQAFAVEAQG